MTKRTKTPKSITVIGRRWYDRCNTYNTATIIVDGTEVHTLPFGYGYEGMYLQRATEWLRDNGYIKLNYPTQTLWLYGVETGCKVHYEASDVARRRDLHLRGKVDKE